MRRLIKFIIDTMLDKITDSIGKSDIEQSYLKGYIQALRDIYFEIDKIEVKE